MTSSSRTLLDDIAELFLPAESRCGCSGRSSSVRPVYFGLVMLLWIPLLVPLYFHLGSPRSGYVLLLAGVVCLAGLFSVRWFRSTRWLGYLLTLLSFATLSGVTYFTGGPYSAALIWLPLVPLLAFLLSGPSAGLGWGAISCITVTAYFFAGQRGYVFPDDLQQGDWQFLHVAAVVGIVGCVSFLLLIFQKGELAGKQCEEENRRAAQAARQKEKLRFLNGMNHLLRTRLEGILGMTELVCDTPLSAEQREYTRHIRHSAQLLQQTVNDFLDYSRLESGEVSLKKSPFDLSCWLEETLSPFQSEAEEKQVQLRWETDRNLPASLVGDAERLRTVLGHLVGNAVKFTRQGRVTVRLRPADNKQSPRDSFHLQVEVQDTGRGIAPERQRAIFAPFSEADTSTTENVEGSGLGLPLAARLIRLMGGSITLHSQPGEGSTFTFVVPLSRPGNAVNADNAEERTSERETADGQKPGGPHPEESITSFRQLESPPCILVADDNAVSRHFAARVLQKAGYLVLTAVNGQDALTVLQSSECHAVLMDLQMPEMDGFAAMEVIRQWEAEAGVSLPVIALTAHTDKEHLQRCREVGMDDFLCKPVKPEELLAAVRRACGVSEEEAFAAAAVAEFSI